MSVNEHTGDRFVTAVPTESYLNGWEAIWGKPKEYEMVDVLADPSHEAHADVKDMLTKLESGEISMCGCMGPMYGEPYCPCAMKRNGLEKMMDENPLRIAEEERARKQWESFDWSKFETKGNE